MSQIYDINTKKIAAGELYSSLSLRQVIEQKIEFLKRELKRKEELLKLLNENPQVEKIFDLLKDN